MDERYAETVRLLLDVAPLALDGPVFALKGGTAINLFIDDMPRLSVDLDLVFLDRVASRDAALATITRALEALAVRLHAIGIDARIVGAGTDSDSPSRLIAERGMVQVKVEPNTVFRGTVLPVATRGLCPLAEERFATSLALPLLHPDEVYASKLVAALDRQHPRDLFDLLRWFERGGWTDAVLDCLVLYVAGHPRPIHELLAPRAKDVRGAFETSFAGMTAMEIGLEALEDARRRLFTELPGRLTDGQRRFLHGLVRLEPDRTASACPHALELPAVRWKLENLERLRTRNPEKFAEQDAALRRVLEA